MLSTLFTIVVVLIIIAIAYLASIKGDYTVSRSRTVTTDIETVFNILADFRTWPNWSPWLMHEPDATLEYSDSTSQVDSYYSWDGKLIGAGKLTHVSLNSPDSIECKLEFTRPFKSICSIKFELEKEEANTKITWIMNGHMPFLFRFMIPKMKFMIGKDYELGLAMLAGHLDAEADHPEIQFHEIDTEESMHCLCESFACDLETMQKLMYKGFPKLLTFVSENNINTTGNPISVYHKVNPKKMYFVGDMAIPVSKDTHNTGDYQLKEIGGGKYFKVSLKGSYEFLELAWNAAYSHLYMKKIKPDFKRSSYEIYETNPEAVDNTNEIITILNIPVK